MVPWRKGEDGGLLMLLALMVGADKDDISRNPGLKVVLAISPDFAQQDWSSGGAAVRVSVWLMAV